MPAGILAKMQNIIRGLVADPKALLQARPEYQLHQQWQGQPQRPDQGNRAVSTGTPQGPFAQIRVPMGAPGQRMMGAVQPDQGNRAVSTGTPQGPFAQIRVPMGAPGQRMMGAVQPGMGKYIHLCPFTQMYTIIIISINIVCISPHYSSVRYKEAYHQLGEAAWHNS